MFSFSKRKLKGGEVGLGFFDSVRKARLAGYPETEELFPQDAEIGLEAVKDEWLYLEIFTVDFVVFLALGKTPEKAAVLTPFWAELKKWLQLEQVDALLERFSFLGGDAKSIPAENSETSFERLMRRMQQYSDCISKPHDLGENHSVATTFAALCGDMDAVTIMGVSSFFSAKKVSLFNALKRLQIVV